MAFINTAIRLLQKYLLYFRVRAVGSAIVIAGAGAGALLIGAGNRKGGQKRREREK